MAINLPPPPPLSSKGFSDPSHQGWLDLLWQKVNKPGNINANQISGVISSTNLPDVDQLTGDVTTDANSVATLATVNSSPGAYGDGANIPSVTVDQKGRVTQIQNTPLYLTAGTYTLPTITDNGNGTVTLGSGDFCFYSDSSGSLPVQKFTIAGATYTPTDQSTNYLIANYNAGSPTLTISTSNSTVNDTTIYTVARIIRSGTHLDIIDRDQPGRALANKLMQRVINTNGIQIEPGGFVLSEAATRYVTVTSGYLWNGIQRVFDPSYNSSVNTLSFYYHVAGVWTKSSITQYNNTQYDDGTNLQSLSASKYAVNWIFKSANSAGAEECYIVLGGGNYNLPQAQASLVPANLPFEITGGAFIVGRIIVVNGATSATQIDSVATTPVTFAPSTIATGLVTTTTNVDVSAATAPTAGQVLTATSSTTATWQTNGISLATARQITSLRM